MRCIIRKVLIRSYPYYSNPYPQPQKSELDGFKTLKNSALILLIGYILYLIDDGVVRASSSGGSIPVGLILGLGIPVIVIMFLGLYFSLIGFKILKNYNPSFGNGFTGSLLLFTFPITFLVGVVLFYEASSSYSLGLLGLAGSIMLLSLVLLVVGNILYGLGYRRIGQYYNIDKLTTGGLLLIFLPFIGIILVYLGLNELIKRMMAGQIAPQPYPQNQPLNPTPPSYYPQSNPTPLPPPPPVTYNPSPIPRQSINIEPIYSGAIRSNGSIKLIVRSNAVANILSIKIEGFNAEVVNINPRVIQPGDNTIRGNIYGPVYGFEQNRIYNILLVVESNGTVQTFRIPSYYIP